MCGTCACGADDAVVNVGAAVDGDLQTVVGIMVLRRLIIRVKLRREEQQRSHSGCTHQAFLHPPHWTLLEASVKPISGAETG